MDVHGARLARTLFTIATGVDRAAPPNKGWSCRQLRRAPLLLSRALAPAGSDMFASFAVAAGWAGAPNPDRIADKVMRHTRPNAGANPASISP